MTESAQGRPAFAIKTEVRAPCARSFSFAAQSVSSPGRLADASHRAPALDSLRRDASMICPACSNENRAAAEFCEECAGPLKRVCAGYG